MLISLFTTRTSTCCPLLNICPLFVFLCRRYLRSSVQRNHPKLLDQRLQLTRSSGQRRRLVLLRDASQLLPVLKQWPEEWLRRTWQPPPQQHVRSFVGCHHNNTHWAPIPHAIFCGNYICLARGSMRVAMTFSSQWSFTTIDLLEQSWLFWPRCYAI